MRAREGVEKFSRWLLAIGNGQLQQDRNQADTDNEDSIVIPSSRMIADPHALLDEIFAGIGQGNATDFTSRVILCPKN